MNRKFASFWQNSLKKIRANKLLQFRLTSLPFLMMVTSYQLLRDIFITPLLRTAFGVVGECRYEETCSRYAVRMLHEHATIPALQKIVRRLASCHGFLKG